MASLKLRIKVTNKCNNNCWFCLSDDKKGNDISKEIIDVSIEKFYNIYKNGNFKRIKIDLTGGDPFNSETILYVTKKLNEVFFNVPKAIVGNVCLPSNISIVKEFTDLGGLVCLSLNENNLNDIINLYKKIDKKSVFLFSVLLSNFNMNRMDKIVDETLKYRLPLRLNYIFDQNPKDETIKKMIDCVNYVYPRLKKEGYKYNIFNYPFGCIHALKSGAESYCGYGQDYYYIDTYGNIKRCHMEEILSNINSNFENDIKKELVYNDKCLKCDVFNLCKGGCSYTNKYNKYCEFQYIVCKHIMDMDFRNIQLCWDKNRNFK